MDALLSLIGSGAKVNVTNSLTGSTALHEAGAFGNKEIVEHLLKNVNADANASDFKAVTPLMHASGAGYSIICLLLLQYGAKIDICSAEGMTVLHFAATNGDSYVTQQIVEAGNRVHVKASIGQPFPFESSSPLLLPLPLSKDCEENGKNKWANERKKTFSLIRLLVHVLFSTRCCCNTHYKTSAQDRRSIDILRENSMNVLRILVVYKT